MLQHIFTNAFTQYLGKISFSLYLVHGFVIHTIYYALIDVLWGVVGDETDMQKEVSFAVALVVVTGVLVWVSDMFTRAVDMPSVKFARWVEGRMIANPKTMKEEPAWRETVSMA